MASLIKNQIIKHLSKFVKNLSSNQINLSTLKGEGELSSIDLDEQAIEDVIELPTWLKIQKATCGRVFIKIPWTSLKTLPIQLQLDEVAIEIETCEDLRNLHKSNDSANASDPLLGKYGFTNRVIDGISITITSLTFTVKAQAFKASIFLPSLEIYSTTPYWNRVDSLKLTRIRNEAKDHILLFKEISWQNARIEASANDDNSDNTAAAAAAAVIRLIANACRIRIAMKKNLQDSTMVTSRVTVHFDDLLSVINDAQLKSALNAYKEVTQLMKRAAQQRKRKAGDKLTKLEQQQQPSTFQPKAPTTGTNDPVNPSGQFSNQQQQSNDPFKLYDVVETSLHFNIKRFDLHIIADSESLNDRLAESGALQLTIANLSVDHYPYHEHGSSKKHWVKYSEMLASNREEWINRLNEEWNDQLNLAKNNAPTDEMSEKLEKGIRTNRIRLYESCTVLNIDDLVFYPVSLNNSKEQKRRRPIITSDRTQYQLPEFLGVINIQHTEYYYPLPYSFPVPDSDLYIQIMPIVIRVDFATSSWLDAFVSTLSLTIDKSGVLKTDRPSTDVEHVAIKLEAMLPRIVVSSDIFSGAYQLEEAKQEDNPSPEILERKEIPKVQKLEILELNISKILLTNCRTESTSNRKKLDQHLDLFKNDLFFHQNQWPLSNTNTSRISSLFNKHLYDTYLYNNPLTTKIGNTLQDPPSTNSALHSYYTMTTDSLKKSAKYDIWHFNADSIYMDFTPSSSSESVRLAKQNMSDNLSITGWAVLDEKPKEDSSTSSPWANILCVLETPSMIKISQKQYTFLMHLVDELGLFLDVLERNRNQTRLLKQKLLENSSSSITPTNDLKLTVCFLAPTTFSLAVLDGLEDAITNLSTPAQASILPEVEVEPVMRDKSDSNVVVDLLTTAAPVVAGTAKVEPSSPSINLIGEPSPNDNLNKGFNLLGQKKTKIEENIQRGLEITSKGSRGSSQTSLANMNDEGYDTASQWDQLSEDLDADVDPTFFTNEYEQQQQQQQEKAARIDIDDDSISLNDKNNTNKLVIGTNALESVNGVFVKVNQIKVCITDNEEKNEKPLYVACNVKNLRIDQFQSLKFDAIKPKLFENERPDDFNDENVPPINVRIDFPKGQPDSKPTVTVQLGNRTLSIATHAIDVILQNLEEIHTREEKSLRKQRASKLVPLDIHLNNLQISIDALHEYPTTGAVVEKKPPIKVHIKRMHVLRQIDGEVIIETSEQETNSNTVPTKMNKENKETEEKLRQAEMLRLENERLRSELSTYKKDITVLRGERDSLMNTISKLDIELTQSEQQRIVQQQQQFSAKK